MRNITKRELQVLQHATAWTNARNPLYRNHFSPGGDDVKVCERLVEKGLMRKVNTTTYYATESGLAELLKIERKATRVLLGR